MMVDGDVSRLETSYASNSATGPFSAGHYSLEFRPGWTEQYSFSAVQLPNGEVGGQFQIVGFRNGRKAYSVHGETTCLVVAPDGRTARMGGVITVSRDRVVRPGWQAAWSVQDNGEGADAPDMGSNLWFGIRPDSPLAQLNCTSGLSNLPPRPVDEGNIQVRP